MTTFVDGAAAGKSLMLRRVPAPVFLRVVQDGAKFDALDQLDDTPKPSERLLAYVLTEEPRWMHMRCGGNKRHLGGVYAVAEYRIVEPQPTDDQMRTNEAWRVWTLHNKHHYRPKSND